MNERAHHPDPRMARSPTRRVRTNADKRCEVLTLLHDPAWRQQSDRAIARQCGVDHKFVGKLRKELSGDIPTPPQARPPVLTGETLLSAGCPPALAQRIHARLAAMPPAQRRQAERLLAKLLL